MPAQVHRVQAECRVQIRLGIAECEQVMPSGSLNARDDHGRNANRPCMLQDLAAIGIESSDVEMTMGVD